MRGYPSKLYSDPGTQLTATEKELKSLLDDLDWETLKHFGVEKGMEWNFMPGDAPWQNGCAEAMGKGVKKTIKGAIGKQVLLYSELQTVSSEAANLINERPIGRHPTEPKETSYLSPNHLLLGCASARVPSGPFEETDNSKKTFSIPPEYHRTILEKVDQRLVDVDSGSFSYVIDPTEVAH